MLQLIVGLLALLAVIFLRDEPSTPYRRPRQYPRYDPIVILALEELDEED